MTCTTTLDPGIQTFLCLFDLQVQWAPKRRESYYLMSERVYNDRLLMKLRADAGDSPLDFQFADTHGNTDDLHEFQKLINETSKDIKGMNFDTEYKNYNYDFIDGKEKGSEEDGLHEGVYENQEETEHEANNRTTTQKGRRKVVFSDNVSESDTDKTDVRSMIRSNTSEQNSQQLCEGLDPNDIEINLEFAYPDGSDAWKGTRSGLERTEVFNQSTKSGEFIYQTNSSLSPNRLSSPGLLSLLQGSSGDGYRSDFTSANESGVSGVEEVSSLQNFGDDYRSTRDSDGKTHCKHLMPKKTCDYYKKLPKLLKTAELRAKLLVKPQVPKLDDAGKDVDHSCMTTHKTAYERALAVARFRSLPFSSSFLARRTTKMNSFSYFPGLPGQKELQPKGEQAEQVTKKMVKKAALGGRKAIFGEIDMDDFYHENDELIYFISPEELKNVVASTSTDEESSSNENVTSSSATVSRANSRTNTFKLYSSLESEADI